MKQKTFGSMIASLRKKEGMTQLELAQRLGITDKAVSKWERDLSYPDIESIPKIAEIFGISVDELMQIKAKEQPRNNKAEEITQIALKGIALAMGVAVAVLSFLKQIDANAALGMLGIGLACIAVMQLPEHKG